MAIFPCIIQYILIDYLFYTYLICLLIPDLFCPFPAFTLPTDNL